MKKNIFNVFMIATFTVATISCKSDKQNEVEPGQAEQAAIAGEAAMEYQIDTTVSTISWRGTKPTGEHIGSIDIESGVLMANSEEIQGGTVTIDMESITVLDEDLAEDRRIMLTNHLKGTAEGKETDFFNVTEYPTALFEITGISENEGQTMLQGNLSIKEDTKNIEFPVTTTYNGNQIILESETFTIDRTDWNVNYGSQSVFDNLGDNWISDDMELTINVTATRAE